MNNENVQAIEDANQNIAHYFPMEMYPKDTTLLDFMLVI